MVIARLAGSILGDVKTAVQVEPVVGVGADYDFCTERVKSAEKFHARIQLFLTATVYGAAVDFKRNSLSCKVFQRLQGGAGIARVCLIEGVHGIVESCDKVEVADERTREAV